MSYPASDVSSWDYQDAYPINFADLFSNCTSRDASYRPASDTPASQDSYERKHCYPLIKYPTGLQAVEPAWSSCSTPIFNGNWPAILDPPRTLGPAAALVPTLVNDQSSTGGGGAAIPAPLGSQPLASKTAPPSIASATVGSESKPTKPDIVDSGSSEDPPTTDPLVSGTTMDPSSIVLRGSRVDAAALAASILVYQMSLGPSISSTMVGNQVHDVQLPVTQSSSFASSVPAASSITIADDGHRIAVPPFDDIVLLDHQSARHKAIPVSAPGPSTALRSKEDLILGNSAIAPNVAGHPFTVIADGVAINGIMLTNNAPAITLSSTPISLGPTGLVIGTSIVPLPIAPKSMSTTTGQSIIVMPNGNLIISSTRVTPSTPVITMAGTSTSIGINELLMETSKIPLPFLQPASSITIGGQIFPFSQDARSVVVAGKTLSVGGPAITILGTPLALESSGLIVKTSAKHVPNLDPSSVTGIGDFIHAGINAAWVNPTVSGSAGSSQTRNNVTEIFIGGGCKVVAHPWELMLVLIPILHTFQLML
ncbi:MAG: hypothetical protein Q9164_006900 [Protoblastenia rupestris]